MSVDQKMTIAQEVFITPSTQVRQGQFVNVLEAEQKLATCIHTCVSGACK